MRTERWTGIVAALGLTLVGLAARYGLQPLFGESHVYTAFYPVVLLAAYAFGAGPAVVAAIFSAALGYWCFDEPVHSVKFEADGLTSLGFFVLTASTTVKRRSKLTPDRRPILTPLASVPGPAARRVAVS